ncbi:glycosyltransferase [Patescibacteria group bacterium]|nr:glycosyltransferase [Patescibacteria group bacterium]
MSKNPFFSIIVITFNSEKTLEKSLNSLFIQTFTNWELIAIDGSSSDSTLKILNKYRNRINYFVSEKDSGIYDAMNKGAAASTGQFLFFLNSDDEFFDNKVLEDVFKQINDDVDLLSAIVTKVYKKHQIIKKNRLTKENLKKGLMPPHQSMFIKKTLFGEVGGYNENYKSSGDFELCCKLFEHSPKYKYIDRQIAFFNHGGMSSDKRIAYFETFWIINNYFGRYFATIFYIKKIILEQGLKKIIKHLI